MRAGAARAGWGSVLARDNGCPARKRSNENGDGDQSRARIGARICAGGIACIFRQLLLIVMLCAISIISVGVMGSANVRNIVNESINNA